jgi:hypothetical protein
MGPKFRDQGVLYCKIGGGIRGRGSIFVLYYLEYQFLANEFG